MTSNSFCTKEKQRRGKRADQPVPPPVMHMVVTDLEGGYIGARLRIEGKKEERSTNVPKAQSALQEEVSLMEERTIVIMFGSDKSPMV